MSARFGLRTLAVLSASAIGALTISTTCAAHADTGDDQKILLKGSTTASYFWDDSSGRAGDTGLPASGKPMQKELAASPSWPLLTEGYVIYNGKKMPFFVGDRGPGDPSSSGVMLDLDAKTFADLTGGTFNSDTLGVDGNGGEGHIKVDYVITKWGEGKGKKNHPVAFSTGAWSRYDSNPAEPPKVLAEKKHTAEPSSSSDSSSTDSSSAAASVNASSANASSSDSSDVESAGGKAVVAPQSEVQETSAVGGAVVAGVLAVAGGGAVLGSDRLRKLIKG
jgi:hypothetical protein